MGVLRASRRAVQVLWNKIEVRFAVFALSSFALFGMIAIAMRTVL